MKRILALILSAALLLGTLGTLSGCSNQPTITKGELLSLMCDRFGMNHYINNQPYTTTVAETDEYFSVVQAAFEWGTIDDTEIQLSDPVTKGFLAVTLVKCVGLLDTEGMSEDEITDYAVQNHYVSFQYRGRTDTIRYVTPEEAQESLDLSFQVWTTRQYETREDATLGEEVVNLADGDVTAQEIVVNKADNTVSLPESVASQLEVGDTFVLPPTQTNDTAAAYQVVSLAPTGDGRIVIATQEAAIENTIQDLKLSGSAKADLNNVPVTDGMGNVINPGAGGTTGMNAMGMENSPGIIPCATGTLSFEVDGIKVTGSVSGDSISFELEGEVNPGSSQTVKVKDKFEVKDISLDYDWEIDWFELKSAYAKLNYTTVNSASLSTTLAEREGQFFFDQRRKPTLANFLNSELRNADRVSKTLTICSFPIVNGGVASINIDIKAKISVTGTVELEITTNYANGIEYKDGNLRYIKEKNNDVDLNVKAKIEGTLYAGVSIKAIGINLLGIGFEGGLGVEVVATAHLVNSDNVEIDQLSIEGTSDGIELAASSIQGSYYEENGKQYSIHIDTCLDLTTYFILRFKMDENCALADVLSGASTSSDGKYKFQIELFGKENAKIDALCTHVEDGTFVETCTRQYNSETTTSSETNSQGDESGSSTESGTSQSGESSEGIQISDSLDLDTYFMSLLEGDSETLQVIELPEGVQLGDVSFTSADANVATVDDNGKVTALQEGSTEIIAKIPGTNYSVSCAVIVHSVAESQFSGIMSSSTSGVAIIYDLSSRANIQVARA